MAKKSIMYYGLDFGRAFEKAHLDYPFEQSYPNKPHHCNHEFSFVVFCDGGDWDIVRCQKCGEEVVTKCSFDDDYC